MREGRTTALCFVVFKVPQNLCRVTLKFSRILFSFSETSLTLRLVRSASNGFKFH